MKKTAFPLLLVLAGTPALGQVEVTVGEVNAELDSRAVVPIVLAQSDELVSAVQFRITFDAASLSIPDGGSVFVGDNSRGHSVLFDIGAGKLSAIVFSSGLANLPSGSVPVAHVVFDVKNASPGAELGITLDEVKTSDRFGGDIPVTTTDGSITISEDENFPLQGENRIVFPQIGNGTFSGGTFFVAMVFVNRTEAEAAARISFYRSNGNPFSLGLEDGRTGSTFNFPVPAGGSSFLKTDGAGDLSAGYAVLDSTTPLGGVLVFTFLSPGGATLAEAGVGASPSGTRFSIPVVFRPALSDTGVAIVNLSSGSSEVSFILRDTNGDELDRSDNTFSGGVHSAVFASQLFADIGSGGDFEGSIEILSSEPVSLVTLKQLSSGLLTTLPVVEPIK